MAIEHELHGCLLYDDSGEVRLPNGTCIPAPRNLWRWYQILPFAKGATGFDGTQTFVFKLKRRARPPRPGYHPRKATP